LYYFPATSDEAATVVTHPLGIGRQGWGTPFVKTRITGKRKHPVWYPPASIREEAAANGEPLPERVGPGPDNPLGDFAMRLGLPSYLIHGTNRPWGVGMRVSHGCIRLYPEDIESLYQQIQVGTAVRIVNQPYKIGVLNSVIYLEAHPRLQENEQHRDKLTAVVDRVIDRLPKAGYTVNWDAVRGVVDQADGIPVAIGTIKADRVVESIPQPRATGISQSRVFHQE
jgi:L,D-transpeptidase ErfK/SrfK